MNYEIKRPYLRLTGCVTAGLSASARDDHDLVILGCRVIDPKTKLDAVRNVSVKDGVIAVITGKPITGKDQTTNNQYEKQDESNKKSS